MSIYDFEVEDLQGNMVSLKEYEGKTILIVNSATECGLTPQYEGLEPLYEKYKDQGFIILDFPCNQFREQAPGTSQEIANTCKLRFNIQYPIFAKIDVNGENEIPLYTYLKEQKGFQGFDHSKMGIMLRGICKARDKDYKNNPDIKWNFTKFLIDKEGKVVERFEPPIEADKIEKKLKEII